MIAQPQQTGPKMGPGFEFPSRGSVIVVPLGNDPYLPSHLRRAQASAERKTLSDMVYAQLQRAQDEETDRMLRGDSPLLNALLANSPKRKPLPWYKRKYYDLRRRWGNAVDAWNEG